LELFALGQPAVVLNVFQTEEKGAHIMTAMPDILTKLTLVGKGLTEYLLETVQMFNNDATATGFSI
jgi:hypothetical protein